MLGNINPGKFEKCYFGKILKYSCQRMNKGRIKKYLKKQKKNILIEIEEGYSIYLKK